MWTGREEWPPRLPAESRVSAWHYITRNLPWHYNLFTIITPIKWLRESEPNPSDNTLNSIFLPCNNVRLQNHNRMLTCYHLSTMNHSVVSCSKQEGEKYGNRGKEYMWLQSKSSRYITSVNHTKILNHSHSYIC